MAETTFYVGEELFLREVQASDLETGTVLIRVGLPDGSEHRISIPPKGLNAHVLQDGALRISSEEGVFRLYRSWVWYDEAPHVPDAGPQIW